MKIFARNGFQLADEFIIIKEICKTMFKVQKVVSVLTTEDYMQKTSMPTLKVKSIKQSKVKESLSLNLQTTLTITKDVFPNRPREY